MPHDAHEPVTLSLSARLAALRSGLHPTTTSDTTTRTPSAAPFVVGVRPEPAPLASGARDAGGAPCDEATAIRAELQRRGLEVDAPPLATPARTRLPNPPEPVAPASTRPSRGRPELPHVPAVKPDPAAVRRAHARVAALHQGLRRAEEFRAYFSSREHYSGDIVRASAERAASLRPRIAQARAELHALRRPHGNRCGAKCRDGHACRAPGNGRGGRCKLHGGKSTGPKTAEGLARAREAAARGRALAAVRPLASGAAIGEAHP